MITQIRRGFQTKWYKMVVWVIVIALILTLSSISSLFHSPMSRSGVVVTVNGSPIDQIALEQRASKQQEQIQLLRQQYGQKADAYLKMLGMHDPRSAALRMLIYETVLNKAAEAVGIDIGTEYAVQRLQDPLFVMQSLSDVLPFQAMERDGSVNIDRLKQFLMMHQQTMKDFEAAIEQKLARTLLLEVVQSAVYVPQSEVKEQFIKEELAKKYGVLLFSIQAEREFLKQQGSTSDQLTAFFKKENERNKRYWTPEMRSGDIWTFNAEEYGLSLSDEEVANYYEHNKQTKYIEKPAQVKVRRILLKLQDQANADEVLNRIRSIRNDLEQSPGSFEELAKKYSEDTETASKGGLMPSVQRGRGDQEFERAAFRLKSDNDISPIVRTASGFELLQRVNRNPVVYKSLASVTDSIRKELLIKKFKAAFANDMDAFIEKLAENPTTFLTFAQEKKAKKDELKNVERGYSPAREKLFTLKKGKWQYLFDGEHAVVVRVTDIQRSAEPTFESVRERVERDWYADQARTAVDKKVQEARALARHQPLAEIKKQLGGSLIQTEFLRRDDKEKLNKLEKQGVPVGTLFTLGNVGSVATGVGVTDGYMLKVEEVEPFDHEKFATKKAELLRDLYQQKQEYNQQGFIASLMRTATIKMQEPIRQSYPIDDEQL